MRASAIILVATFVSSAAPSLAAPIPVPTNAQSSSDLQARARASALLKPFLKSAGSSAAVGGLLGILGNLTGGDDSRAAKRTLTDDQLASVISHIENSKSNLTQAQVDEVEAELERILNDQDGLSTRALPSGISKEVGDFLAGVFGSITGKAATNAALGNNIDGSPKSRRDAELAERAGASALVKPFLKGAAGSAAVGGFFGAIGKLFGGDENPQKRDVAERAGAAGLIKPFVKGAAGSAAVGGFFGALDKLFGGDGAQKRATQDLSVDTMISTIEKSGAFTQEQLDEVEAELTKSLSSVHTRSIETRAVKVGGLTKGLVGVLGSIAGSFGIDALFGNNNRRAVPLTYEDMIATIENSSEFTQAQLDEVEAELSKAMTDGLTSRSNLEVRAVKLGGLTKGLVGVIGSLAGSFGIDTLLGGDKAARAYKGLNALD